MPGDRFGRCRPCRQQTSGAGNSAATTLSSRMERLEAMYDTLAQRLEKVEALNNVQQVDDDDGDDDDYVCVRK